MSFRIYLRSYPRDSLNSSKGLFHELVKESSKEMILQGKLCMSARMFALMFLRKMFKGNPKDNSKGKCSRETLRKIPKEKPKENQ